MPNPKLQAKIKIAQKQLGIEDDHYRDILYRKFRVSSSKSLSDSQAHVLIRFFKNLGWVEKSKPKKYDDQKGDAYSASPKIKRKIEAMWHDLYRGNEEKKHLRQWLFNKFKISDVVFLDKRAAYDAVEALKNMTRRRQDLPARSAPAKAGEENGGKQDVDL
jgi:phage gp16-like protein